MQRTNYNITISGLNLSRLLSELSKNNITLYNFKKPDYKSMTFSLTYLDYKKLKNLKMLQNYDIKINKVKGIVKLQLGLIKHLGLVISGLICFALFVIFSNYTLKINIYGLENINEIEIIKLLNDFNIKENQINTKSNEDIEQYLKQNNDKISLVSVARYGTNLVVNIKEKIEIKVDTTPITAPYNMQITKLDVKQGSTNFKVGDIVKKGDIIVSSSTILSNGEKTELKPIATVEGTTWITGNVEFKSKYTELKRTGKKQTVSYYEFNDNKLFYKTPNVKFEKYDKIVYNDYVFKNWFLPIKYCKITYYELKENIIEQNFEENKESLIAKSVELAYKNLPYGQNVLEKNTVISNNSTNYYVTTYLKINVKVN